MNFISEGYAFANIRWINLIQAICVIVVLSLFVFGLLPLGITGKIYVGIPLIGIPTLITLRGVNDLSITSYLADVLETRRYGRVYGKPNNADRISRQRNLERKRHKQLKDIEKSRKKEEKENSKLTKKRRLGRGDVDDEE